MFTRGVIIAAMPPPPGFGFGQVNGMCKIFNLLLLSTTKNKLFNHICNRCVRDSTNHLTADSRGDKPFPSHIVAFDENIHFSFSFTVLSNYIQPFETCIFDKLYIFWVLLNILAPGYVS